MASIIQKKRLANEVKLLKEQPLHYCTSYPDETNQLIWYFIIIGQKGTDYHGGEYIGKIVHSPKYPAEPPDYYMLTPSGRYSVGSKICLTNSSYHKGDWSSTWNILSILIAFYSIWLDDKEHGISHITDTPANRKRMAGESIEYNKKNNTEIYAKFDRTYLKDDAPIQLMKKKEEPVPTTISAELVAHVHVVAQELIPVPVVAQELIQVPVVAQELIQVPVVAQEQPSNTNKIEVEVVYANEPDVKVKKVKKAVKAVKKI